VGRDFAEQDVSGQHEDDVSDDYPTSDIYVKIYGR
jgi:hypothetical protein